jgi:hypothetical protein
MIIDFEEAKGRLLKVRAEASQPEPADLPFMEQAVYYARRFARERLAELKRAQPKPK